MFSAYNFNPFLKEIDFYRIIYVPFLTASLSRKARIGYVFLNRDCFVASLLAIQKDCLIFLSLRIIILLTNY
jgi:hypothetical protein